MVTATTERTAPLTYWQDWSNLALAAWLFVSPWVLNFGARMGPQPLDTANPDAALQSVANADWNAWAVAMLIAVVTVTARVLAPRWQESANIVLAFWLLFAPSVLNFADLAAAAADQWLVAVGVILLSISCLMRGPLPARGKTHSRR